MMRLFSLILVLMGFQLFAQEPFDLRSYLRSVSENHPVARQARLNLERASWEITAGRGFLDPKLVSSYETKDFNNKDYYDLWNSYLLIPTQLNVDFKAGFERNSGIYQNPESTVPIDGLYYAGISVPLGRGMFLNERVYQRKMGILQGEQMKVESNLILNNLLFEASIAYWDWFSTIQRVKVYEAAVSLANENLDGTRESFLNGDKAAIDTTESLIQVQTLSNELVKARLDSATQTLILNNYLWTSDFNPSLSNEWPKYSIQPLEEYESVALQRHPHLLAMSVQQDQLINDKRYYAEMVKPQLDFNYNFLLENNESKEFNTQDYKAGVDFSIPVLLRKERAKLNITRIKLDQNELKASQKRQEILNKVRADFAKLITTRELLENQVMITDNYLRLLDGERQKFVNGESSIFLINNRQNKFLEAQIKQIELEVNFQIYRGSLLWSSATIQNLID